MKRIRDLPWILCCGLLLFCRPHRLYYAHRSGLLLPTE